MKNINIVAIAVLLSALSISCRSSQVVVKERPPAPLYSRPAPPRANYIWIEGEYVRTSAGYVYRQGYWIAPKKDRVYRNGYWRQTRRGYVWVPGRW